MIAFELVGGPFDGGEGNGRWKDVPLVVWAIHDPKSPGKMKGRVYRRQRPGAFPYSKHETRDGVTIYIYSDVTDDGWRKLTKPKPEPVTASFEDWLGGQWGPA